MLTTKLASARSVRVEHILGKINSPNTRPRSDIQHAPGLIDRGAIQRAAEEHFIDMMAQIEAILLLFIVWLPESIEYPKSNPYR